MSGARKYWTDAELLQDAEYWEKEEKRLFLLSVGSQHQDRHDYYQQKQHTAHQRAKASRDELTKRHPNDRTVWSDTQLHNDRHYWSNVQSTLTGDEADKAKEQFEASNAELVRRHPNEDDES